MIIEKSTAIIKINKLFLWCTIQSTFPISGEFINDDIKENGGWVALKLWRLKNILQSNVVSYICKSLMQYIEKITPLINNNETPIIFIEKEKVISLSKINLNQWNSIILKNVKTIIVEVDEINEMNLESSIERLLSIPANIQIEFKIKAKSIKKLSENKQVAEKIMSFSILKIDCKKFIFEKINYKWSLNIIDNQKFSCDSELIYIKPIKGTKCYSGNNKKKEMEANAIKKLLRCLICPK